MSLKQIRVEEKNFAGLGSCLIEGDSEQRRRERRIKRRALALSIALQATALAALILIPIFGKTERIALAVVPVPPYYHPSSAIRRIVNREPQPSTPNFNTHTIPFFTQNAPLNRGNPGTSNLLEDPLLPSDPEPTITCAGCIDIGGAKSDPKKPNVDPPPSRTHVVHVTHLDPAMLIHRVEPRYPPIALQTHRGGRVELRAIIAVDGTIQSLQVSVAMRGSINPHLMLSSSGVTDRRS